MEKVKNAETLGSEEVLKLLGTDKTTGLTEEEAARRLELYGKNKLAEKAKEPWWKIFFSQFNDAMIFVLFAAIIVTAIVSVYETVKCIRGGGTRLARRNHYPRRRNNQRDYRYGTGNQGSVLARRA